MSLKSVMKEMRQLNYADMMVLAEELAKQVPQNPTANHLASILIQLDVAPAEMSDLEKQEDKILREIFKVKRQLIVKHDNGFSMGIPTLPASTVIGVSPRAMFPQLIDQIVTMHALVKGMKT